MTNEMNCYSGATTSCKNAPTVIYEMDNGSVYASCTRHAPIHRVWGKVIVGVVDVVPVDGDRFPKALRDRLARCPLTILSHTRTYSSTFDRPRG